MADYFPVLSRAVAGLENNTADARRAVYERARAAIVRQLRAIEPPLPEEHIAREQTQLEEAIRRIEAEAGAPVAAATPAPVRRPDPVPPAASAKPAGAPPPPANAPQPRPEAGAARPVAGQPDGAASDKPAVKAGSPRPAAAKPDAPRAPRPQETARPAARADGRPIIQAGAQPRRQGEAKRSGPLVAIAALLVIGVGAGLFAARGHIASLLGGGSSTTAPQQEAAKQPEAAPAPSAEEKASDRLTQDAPTEPAKPQDSGQASTPPQTTTQEPAQDVARAPEPTSPQPSEPAQPAAPAQSAPPAPSQAGPLVAQRAVLYEEGPNQQSGEASQGTVTWRTESVNGGSDQPLETALRGDIEIPGRKLRATLTLRRNADATLPASHTIEIQFSLPEDFPNAGISNVPGVLMKADEAARGAAVSGLSVRVTSGFFLIGLSNMDAERTVNEQLLRDRGWIDIPILYDNGRRAVLTLEKGTPGSQAFQEAFSAWRSASSQAPATGNP